MSDENSGKITSYFKSVSKNRHDLNQRIQAETFREMEEEKNRRKEEYENNRRLQFEQEKRALRVAVNNRIQELSMPSVHIEESE